MTIFNLYVIRKLFIFNYIDALVLPLPAIHWYRTRREFVVEEIYIYIYIYGVRVFTCIIREYPSVKSQSMSESRRFARYIRHTPSNNPGRGMFEHNSGRGSNEHSLKTTRMKSRFESALETIVVFWQSARVPDRNTYPAAYSRLRCTRVSGRFFREQKTPVRSYNFCASF